MRKNHATLQNEISKSDNGTMVFCIIDAYPHRIGLDFEKLVRDAIATCSTRKGNVVWGRELQAQLPLAPLQETTTCFTHIACNVGQFTISWVDVSTLKIFPFVTGLASAKSDLLGGYHFSNFTSDELY
jgi:hypothetical protein